MINHYFGTNKKIKTMKKEFTQKNYRKLIVLNGKTLLLTTLHV